MARAQAALEYLIIAAAVVVFAAVIYLLVTNYVYAPSVNESLTPLFGSSEGYNPYNQSVSGQGGFYGYVRNWSTPTTPPP
ncbi:MAG: hypothetical protein AB1626_05000 [Candidatus Micrarchaeota archaeon]